MCHNACSVPPNFCSNPILSDMKQYSAIEQLLIILTYVMLKLGMDSVTSCAEMCVYIFYDNLCSRNIYVPCLNPRNVQMICLANNLCKRDA